MLPAQEGAFLAHKREERKITSPKSSRERAPRLPCTKARRANRWQFTLVVQPDASNLSKIWLLNSSWRQLPWGKSDSWYHVLKLPWPAQYGWKKGRCRETRAAQKLFLEDVSAYEAEAIKNLEAELLILSGFFFLYNLHHQQQCLQHNTDNIDGAPGHTSYVLTIFSSQPSSEESSSVWLTHLYRYILVPTQIRTRRHKRIILFTKT